MPFGQDGVTQPKELGESKVDMRKGFKPSHLGLNPLIH